MSYELSGASLFIGIIILIAGGVFIRYYQWIADNFGSGVSSYDRYRLVGIIACVLGIVVMLNLHTFFLLWVLGLFFR